MCAELERINVQLAQIHRGRKWIVAVDGAAAATSWVDRLRTRKASDIAVVAAVPGVGPLPDCRLIYTETPGVSVMEGFRSFFDAIQNPVDDLVALLDQFDPDRSALLLLPPFGPGGFVLGREVYGARLESVEALEDKTTADALWDSAGIARAMSEVVEVANAPDAHRRLRNSLGTVWAADNQDGWHGGGEYT
jgi:hypothetical protein